MVQKYLTALNDIEGQELVPGGQAETGRHRPFQSGGSFSQKRKHNAHTKKNILIVNGRGKEFLTNFNKVWNTRSPLENLCGLMDPS
ncbi:hypothetical protein CEXT_757331 [Caerostris extrusa]|uniref:Uncharacterized protein n=1 Tax=Caerostris extrusa TaxID=172846 RepID=A0AAV4NUU0_CAEEX|nr:hypothetical protein CEXT_757331 [Caerostris extrusa]